MITAYTLATANRSIVSIRVANSFCPAPTSATHLLYGIGSKTFLSSSFIAVLLCHTVRAYVGILNM